jgi:GNAT superfamily N-acetyltransferase
MEFFIRPLEPDEFKSIYVRIKRDFAFGEYAPYRVLKRQLADGRQQGWLFFAGGRAAAYAICAGDTASGVVLISYFAVFDEMRGRGMGTAFLEDIKKAYTDARGIVAEVEKPENAKTAGEKALRERRMAFYRRAGFEPLFGIDYSIWNVPMHLMVFPPGADPEEIGRAVHAVYLSLMGRRFIHMLKIACGREKNL